MNKNKIDNFETLFECFFSKTSTSDLSKELIESKVGSINMTDPNFVTKAKTAIAMADNKVEKILTLTAITDGFIPIDLSSDLLLEYKNILRESIDYLEFIKLINKESHVYINSGVQILKSNAKPKLEQMFNNLIF
jgi:hypothetical protein